MVGSLGPLASELGLGLAPTVLLGSAAGLLGLGREASLGLGPEAPLGLGPEAPLLVDRLGPPVRVVVVRARPDKPARYIWLWLTLRRHDDRL